jgi:glutamyl-tRNA synthetase
MNDNRDFELFSEEELKKFNTKLIHNMPYVALKNTFGISEEFWNKVKGNLDIANDILVWDNICDKEIEPVIEDVAFTAQAAEMLPKSAFDENTFGAWMNELKTQTGRKGKELFHPLRMALTAQSNGPELKTLLPLIGYEKAYKRLLGEKA